MMHTSFPLRLRRPRSPGAPCGNRAGAAWLVVGAAAVLLLGACQGDGLTPSRAEEDASQYWALELSDHVVTLSTAPSYDTVRVVAVPRTHDGQAIAGLPTPQYRSTDPDKVVVSADGVLIAVAPTTELVEVIAELTTGNLLHADTLYVKVVDDPAPPVLASFSIQPVPPDSTRVPSAGDGYTAFSSLAALDHFVRASTADAPIADVLTWFRSSDPKVAHIRVDVNHLSYLEGIKPGTVTIYARTNLFGVVKEDSVRFDVTWPIGGYIHAVEDTVNGSIKQVFDHPAFRIAPGGVIIWDNSTSSAADVTFADPTNVAAAITSTLPDLPGDLLCFLLSSFWGGSDCTLGGSFVMPPRTNQSLSRVIRVFPVAGTYEYHNSAGSTAAIIVE